MARVPNEILAVLRRGGLIELGDEPAGEPLAGGVSSDIWLVPAAPEPLCVKRALAKLRVRADWRVPVERSGHEAAWMREAAAIVPAAVPRLIHEDQAASALVMAYLEPARYRSWKHLLQAGEVDLATAAAVGERLGRIHAATACRTDLAARFATDEIFHAIRLEPYLLATARAHPALAEPLRRLARRTAATKLVLVHGDVSPKNILVGPDGPVFLDAECAWYGDPAFDLAFCVNHLLLKCLWTPPAAPRFLAAFDVLADAYQAHVGWELGSALEARAATLLPGLLLARIDGKSPVEYVTSLPDKERVRRVASAFLTAPVTRLAILREAWAVELGL